MRYTLFLALLFFLTSCSDKQKEGFFEPTKYQQQALINTKRDEFSQDGTRYLVMTTYISSINTDITNKNKEEFLVGVYSTNQEKEATLSHISLNGSTKNIHIQKLSKDDKRLKLSLMQNSWTSYFLITTPLINSPNLTLSYEIDHLHKVSLVFLKEM